MYILKYENMFLFNMLSRSLQNEMSSKITLTNSRDKHDNEASKHGNAVSYPGRDEDKYQGSISYILSIKNQAHTQGAKSPLLKTAKNVGTSLPQSYII